MAKKKPVSDQQELIDRLGGYHTEGEDGNTETFQRMSKCERYAVGDQWDKEVLEYNKRKKKFSLTVNRILPVVNQVSGFEAKNPKEIKVSNLRGGTQKGAEILSALAKHTMDLSHSQQQQNQSFEDGIRCGRGFIELDVCYDRDPTSGEAVLVKKDPFMVIPDPCCKSYDFNDPKNGAKYIIVEDWIDKEIIHGRYPGREDELGESDQSNRRYSGMFSGLLKFIFGSKTTGESRTTYREGHSIFEPPCEMDKYKYRVSKYYWKEWVKGAVLIKSGPSSFMQKVLTNKKQIEAARNLIEMFPDSGQLIEEDKNGNPVVVPVLHRALMVGDVLLEHKEDPFNGMSLFPVFRFAPYFVNGYEFGMVENLLGPQDQTNWSWSMELNLIRQLANAGWIIKSDVSGTYAEFLEDHGGEDGVVLEKNKAGGEIEKLDANNFPQHYDIITERGAKHILEISQVRLEEPQDLKGESGRAIFLKQQAAQTNTSNIQSNWDYTLRLMGEALIELIRTNGIYTEEEIRAVVDEEQLIDGAMLREAQQTVIKTLEGKGIPEMQPPKPPSQADLSQPEIGGEYIRQYQAEMEAYRQYVDSINKLAIPIAQAKLLDEIKTLKYGRYGTKVELSPKAETFRTKQAIETFELNKALVESGQPGVSRANLINATDVGNKEKIINDVPQPQQPAAAAAR